MPFSQLFCVLRKLDPIRSHFRPHRKYPVIATAGQKTLLRTTVPFITADLEIFHCTHHPVIPKSDLYFTFCSTLTLIYLPPPPPQAVFCYSSKTVSARLVKLSGFYC